MTLDIAASHSLRTVHSTLAGDDIGKLVQACFPVGPVQACHLARRGFNDVYELQAKDGTRFIARLSAIRARGAPNVAYEFGLLTHLKRSGAAVAAPIGAINGEPGIEVHAPEGPRALAVFEFLPGEMPEGNAADNHALGAGLAQIHALSRTYDGPPSLYTLDLDHLLRRPLARLLALSTLDDKLGERFAAIAHDLDAKISATTGLSTVACHGDCHGGNNLMTTDEGGNRVASFFDFDDAGPGFLAYDLGVFLWAATQSKKPDEPTPEPWTQFIAGYKSVTPVAPVDFDAIAWFASVRHFWFLGEYASRVDQWGTQALPRRWLSRQAELLAAWQTRVTPDGVIARE